MPHFSPSKRPNRFTHSTTTVYFPGSPTAPSHSLLPAGCCASRAFLNTALLGAFYEVAPPPPTPRPDLSSAAGATLSSGKFASHAAVSS